MGRFYQKYASRMMDEAEGVQQLTGSEWRRQYKDIIEEDYISSIKVILITLILGLATAGVTLAWVLGRDQIVLRGLMVNGVLSIIWIFIYYKYSIIQKKVRDMKMRKPPMNHL